MRLVFYVVVELMPCFSFVSRQPDSCSSKNGLFFLISLVAFSIFHIILVPVRKYYEKVCSHSYSCLVWYFYFADLAFLHVFFETSAHEGLAFKYCLNQSFGRCFDHFFTCARRSIQAIPYNYSTQP